MGEAKRRERSEQNFGNVPKSANYRGLVVSSPIEIEGRRILIKSGGLHPQELRFALLFWDRLVWPSTRVYYYDPLPDQTFLESAGILTRPEYTVNGDAAEGIARAQIQAFHDLERIEPGVWALAQGENSFLLKEGLADVGKGALIELHRAIPIPKHDVPLADILEFRQRRRDELVLLRYLLDSFVSEMESTEDKTMVLQKRIAELDKACSNLLAVGKEWRFPVYLSDIKVSFNLTPAKFLPAIAGGWKMGESYGLTSATAVAAVAGAVSTLEIKGDYGLRTIKRPTSPFRYAYSIDRELR